MSYKTILILIAIALLSIASPATAYQWNDFTVSNPYVSGNSIVDHNNFIYSSTTDGIYNVNYGNGRSTYFGFALSGTASGTNFVKFTSDYTWTKSVSQTGDNIDVRATNNENNWKTDFAFTPYSTKITNTLTNTLPVSITNAKFYYVFTVNQGDTILYNNVNYTIPVTPNIHLAGDLTSNIPAIKINGNMLFDYRDIIDNGFSITDVYLKPGNTLGLSYAGNVAAIGFTKNGGVFPAGYTVTIDPTITNGDFSNGSNGWYVSGNTSMAVISPNIMKVTIGAPDVTNQLYQYDISLSPDTYYHFEALMNSSSGHNIDINLFKHGSPYTNYGLDWDNINIDSSLTRYETNFTTSGFSSPVADARLQFYFGTMGYANEKYYFDNISLEKLYFAPAPMSLTATQGNFWINHSWSNGTGSITDSYNVSQNGTWTNGSATPFLNTTVSPHGWSNITVHAYNASGYTNLSSAVSLNTQLANNPAVIGNISATYTLGIGALLQIIPSALDLDSDPLTFATDATNGTFYTNNGTLLWTPQAGDNGTYNWYINVTDGNGSTDTFNFAVSVNSNTPGTPLNLIATTGNFFVNHTWDMSVNTDSFNVSVNGIWVNGTTTPFNNTTVSPHGYSNITVYGYNLTSGTLGNSTSLNSQVPNNNPTIGSMSISAASITTAETLTITAINASDLDSDNVTFVNVSVLFNLGGTINYSMVNTANTSNWTYGYTSGTAGSYTITGFYVSDNDTASDVLISASQGFTVTTPATPGSGSSGGSGTTTNTTINNTIIVGKTPIAPPKITAITIAESATGRMVLWGFLILSAIWFFIVFITPNKSVLSLILPIILMGVFTYWLKLW